MTGQTHDHHEGRQMSKVYEYEVVFRVTMTEPLHVVIPDPADRNIKNVTDASCVVGALECRLMDIRDVNNGPCP